VSSTTKKKEEVRELPNSQPVVLISVPSMLNVPEIVPAVGTVVQSADKYILFKKWRSSQDDIK
jgi:hypothetical protein